MRPAAKVGVSLFLVSETIFFLMFVLAFIVFRNMTLAMVAETLDFPTTSGYTLCLLASGLTVWRAAQISANFDGSSPRPWLAATLALGSVFLCGQAREYARLLDQNVSVSQSLFGTTFLTVIGIYGLHVLLGLVLISGALWITRKGRVERPEAVQIATAFWLFVSAVWLEIFSVIYLRTFLWGD
jgi:cytochrome c oxidase subunit 3